MIWKVWVFKFAFSSFAFSRGDTSLHMFLFIPISLCNDDLHEEETEVRENGGIGLINNTCKALIDYQQPLSFLLTFFAWTAELISIVSRMHSYVPTKIWIFNKSKVSLTASVQNVFDKSLPTLKRLMTAYSLICLVKILRYINYPSQTWNNPPNICNDFSVFWRLESKAQP